MYFDTQRAAVEINTPTNEDRMAIKIKMQINESRVEMLVDLSSLYQALGITLHGLFESGVYHRCVHSETLGPDIEYNDHRTSAVQLEKSPISPTRTPSTQLQLASQEPLGEAVFDYEIKNDL